MRCIVQALVADLAYFYRHSTRNPPQFALSGGNTSTGIADTQRGVSDAGLVSRNLLAEDPPGLVLTPLALSGICLISSRANPVPSLSRAQLQDIVAARVTNWSQIGGQSGVIIPMIPQAGSGTRSFFEAQLKTANGGTAVTLASTVVEVQEHDPSVFTAAPNAVAPFSIGRAGLANATSLVHIETGTASDGNASFTAKRAVYDVVRGTDVRGILAGHLHYSTSGTFAGIPVSVASATCYAIDNSGGPGSLVGRDAGQAFNLVHLYEDSVVHTIVPMTTAPQVSGFSGVVLDVLAQMTPEERLEAFSNKRSTFNVADAEASGGS